MPESITYNRIPADALKRWAKVRAVCAGADEVKKGGYLPYLNKADTSPANIARNEAYVERAQLYNATGRTKEGLIGLAFRRDPSNDLPERLKYLLEDADGAGVSIYQQSQSVLGNVLEVARHGLYVDYSEGLKRPVIKSYLAEDIINWRPSLVGGKVVLSLVVLKELVEVPDGYGYEPVVQYRELLLEEGVFVSRVWQETEAGAVLVEEIAPNSRSGKFDYIPFAFVGATNNDEAIDNAPLYDLAELNIGHFRNSADYEDSVFFVGQAQPWISGLDQEWRDFLESKGELYIGSRNPILLPESGAFGFAQVQPNTLAKEAMDHKEAQMISLGARLIETTRANKTASEDNNDEVASTSVLSLAVANVSEAYKRCIAWCGRYLDMGEVKAEYKINQDFASMSLDPQTLTAIVAAWQSGAYAKVDLRAFLRRLGVIAAERTDDLIESDVQSEGPAMGDMGGGTQEAIDQLNAAIALHEKHMNGTAPTTGKAGDASQQKMMDQMTAALAALNGGTMGSMEGM